MANLRANKITSTEVFETTGSVQFTGTTSALSVPAGADFAYGTGAFTIECFIYAPTLEATPGAQYSDHIIYSQTVGGTNYLYLAFSPNGTLYWTNTVTGGGTPVTTSSGVMVANKWQHIAVSRDSNNIFRIFVDGSSVYSGYNNFDFNNTTYNPTIGNYTHFYSQLPFTGHISNFRILKGTALYTNNFTPPTRELTVIPNTVLLACQSTTNAAQEATGKTITVNGNAVANELTPGLLTDRVKSGGSSAITGSVEFDGNDYLAVSSSDFAFGTGDFTLEFWFYDTSPTSGIRRWITSTLGAFGAPTFVIREQSGSIGYRQSSSTVTYSKSNTSWSHIAYTRKSGVEYVFVNGILLGSASSTSNYADNTLYIGGYYNVNDTEYTQGFISNLRIIKGTALYTSNFIPPTRELKKLPGTVLLCCKNSSDPTAEETGKTITPYGSLDRTNLGVELVTNGTFDANVTGWTTFTGNGGSIAWQSGGYLRITNADTTDPPVFAWQAISTVPGKTYLLTAQKISGTHLHVYASNSNGSQPPPIINGCLYTDTETGVRNVQFTATNTTTYIIVRVNANIVATVDVDNVSVTKLDPGTKPPFTPSIGSDGSVTFDGVTKINTPNYFYLPTGNTEDRGRGRGLFGGGVEGANAANTIQYINIQSSGNAIDFGDLTQARHGISACSSATRGVFGGGIGPTVSNVIDYVSIQTQGNAQDFGDLLIALRQKAALSNNSRGIFSGGYVPAGSIVSNSIEFITIASIGNAIDFGDLITITTNLAGCSSPTRGLFGGGSTPTTTNTISYVTISSTGNAQDFGDLTSARGFLSACSSPTRGIFGGGSGTNIIEYVTISSTGNAIDFGDLSTVKSELGACSNSARGVFGGGYTPARLNVLEFITITSTGNAQDFGDLLVGNSQLTSCSDSHGGLG